MKPWPDEFSLPHALVQRVEKEALLYGCYCEDVPTVILIWGSSHPSSNFDVAHMFVRAFPYMERR